MSFTLRACAHNNLVFFQRSLNLILLQKHRDLNGNCVVYHFQPTRGCSFAELSRQTWELRRIAFQKYRGQGLMCTWLTRCWVSSPKGFQLCGFSRALILVHILDALAGRGEGGMDEHLGDIRAPQRGLVWKDQGADAQSEQNKKHYIHLGGSNNALERGFRARKVRGIKKSS